MSVVLCVCTNNYGILASDGRVCDVEKNEVVNENCPKVMSLNKNIAIGFMGNLLIGKYLIESFNDNRATISYDSAYDIIKKLIKEKDYGLLGARVFMIGKTNKKLTVSIFDSAFPDDSKKHIPDKGIYAIYGGFPNGINQDEYVQKYLNSHTWKTEIDIKTSLSKCIIDVAKINNTVNSNIYIEEMFL